MHTPPTPTPRRQRPWLRWLLATLLAVVVLAVAAPLVAIRYYQDTLKAYLLAELDAQLAGRTELDGLRLAPFANFPYISVDLQGLRFYADKTAQAAPLYQFGDVYVGFDVAKLLRGQLEIRQLTLARGHVYVTVDEQGRMDLLEAKKSKANGTDQASPLHLDLRAIRLEDLDLKETNHKNRTLAHLHVQRADARFSLTDSLLRLHLDTEATLREYVADSVALFRDKRLELHSDLDYALARQFLTIRPGKLTLQNGEIDFGGTVDLANQATLDLRFAARKDNFDLFVSLAPEAVAQALAGFTNRGDIYLRGTVTGPSLHQNPHVEVELGCANTFFTRKESNRDVVKDLQFRGFFTTGDSNSLQTSSFYLESLYGKPENSFVKGEFRVDNFARPLINLDFHADLDLEHLPDFLPTGGLQQGSGKIKVDLTLKEFVSADQALSVASQLQDGTASRIQFQNVRLRWPGYPHAIEQLNGQVRLMGDHLEATDLRAKVAGSDLQLSLKLDDLLHYLHGDDVPVAFGLVANAQRLALGELVPESMRPDSARQAPYWQEVLHDLHAEVDVRTTSQALRRFRYLPTLAIDFHDFRFRAEQYALPVHEIKGHLDLSDERASLRDLRVRVGPNQLEGGAELAPVAPLLADTVRQWANFRAEVRVPYLDVRQLLTYRGKCLVNEEIEREVIRQLEFRGQGRLLGGSFGPKGFAAELDIQKLQLKLNDFPLLQKVSGQIRTDTLGSIHLHELAAVVGRSDFRASLDLLHYLDGDLKNKNIQGTFQANWLDLDSLLGYYEAGQASRPKDSAAAIRQHEEAFNLFALPFPTLALKIDIANFRYHKYVINHLRGQLRSTPQHYAYIDSLHLDAADGHLVLHGYLNGSDPKNIYLKSFLRLQKVDLSKLMYKFDNFGQDYLLSENVRGLMDAEVTSDVRLYPDFAIDLARTQAHAEVRLRDGRLLHFAPMHAMADFMGEKDLDDIRFGELTNTLDIRDGQVVIPAMKLTSSLGYLHLSGKQNFAKDQDMDYEIRLPLSLVKQASWNLMKTKVFGRRKPAGPALATSPTDSASVASLPPDEELVDEEKEIIEGQKGLLRKYINVRVAGSPSDFKINLGRKRKGDKR
jgi:uncharacterized protein involved in outer membrane biogenesis